MIARILVAWILSWVGAFAQDAPKLTLPPGDSASDRLKNAEGVVKPPENVDPQMRTVPPNPESNSTPVIPPPGTPENRPDVKPK